MHVRSLLVTALVLAAGALSACGGTSEPAAPPGSAGNPLVAELPEQSGSGEHNEGPSSAEPGYQNLVDRQSSNPDTRFTPCNLVTARQARAILGAPIAEPVEAPQGPTCIYRTESGGSFVTVAVQDRTLEDLAKQMRRPEPVGVSGRRAYCVRQAQPTLHVSLGSQGVLSVSAPCSIAREFAARAISSLRS